MEVRIESARYRIALADEEEQAVDRGEPGDVHRHAPVDDGGGHGERVDDDAGAADVLELLDPVGRGVWRFTVASQAEHIEPPRVEPPDGEANEHDDDISCWVQHGALEVEAVGLNFTDHARLQRRVRIVLVGVLRPEIKALHEDCGDDPVAEDQGQRARHGFEWPAEQQAPLAARAVLDHEERKAAHGPAESEQQTENPCAQQSDPSRAGPAPGQEMRESRRRPQLPLRR